MKKLLATLLAIVMLLGSFSMVSFAQDAAVEETTTFDAAELVSGLLDLVSSKTEGEEINVGEIVDAVLGAANGEANVGDTVNAVIDAIKGANKDSLEVAEILEIVDAIAKGEADFNEDGAMDLNDLVQLIEERVSADAGDDVETTLIVSIVFTVIKLVLKLVTDFFAA